MKNDEFVLLLHKATENDNEAIYEIILMYKNLIRKKSYVNGRYDEDCEAEIVERVCKAIKKFKIF